MQLTSSTLIAALLVPSALATIHTTCYNYFLKKDGCVYSAADNRNRCPAPAKPAEGAVPTFGLSHQSSPSLQKRGMHHTLVRRYDTTEDTFPVLGGEGICGSYDTNKDEGACLWTGTSDSGDDPSTAGWLNGAKTSNCGKRLYIQRTGQPDTVIFAPIIDGCSFDTFDPTNGCFQIALTNKTFNALNPTPQEIDRLAIWNITWDFDNLDGCNPAQGPV